MAHLSPFVSSHLGVHGTYSFVLPDLATGHVLAQPGWLGTEGAVSASRS
jgi:hypothetical protein